MAAEVRVLARPASCLICLHADLGPQGAFCTLVGEQILDEKGVARDCETYLEDPDAT